jgi:hypothetical protein
MAEPEKEKPKRAMPTFKPYADQLKLNEEEAAANRLEGITGNAPGEYDNDKHPKIGPMPKIANPEIYEACKKPEGWGEQPIDRKPPIGHIPGKDGFGPTRARMQLYVDVLNNPLPRDEPGATPWETEENCCRHVLSDM